jgi:hypothetical protein
MAFSLTPIVHTSEVFESKDEPSNVQPNDFHSVVLTGGRRPFARSSPAETRNGPHRYLRISWKEARHGRAAAIEITTAGTLEI